MFRHLVLRLFHADVQLPRWSLPPVSVINIYQSNGEQERVTSMKRMFVLIMTVMLCFALTACNKKVSIDFPFELSSIENVEMFRFTNPADAEKKVITESEDIEGIYQTFESISLKDKRTEPTTGGSVTSFRFHLSDGTSYEIIYSEIAVKSGRIITTDMEQDLFTSADIGANWERYDYEAVTVSEGELPVLPKSEDANQVRFGDRMVDTDHLSKETLAWLEWYHSLSEEEQAAVSSIPPDLYDHLGFADTEDAEAIITE